MSPLLLIAAVEAETSLLRQLLEGTETFECAQRQAVRGRLCGTDVILLSSGVGKANAAAATAVALERFAPRAVVAFGSAGAYLGSGLRPGDLVLVQEEIMADEGVACEDRFLDFEALGFPAVERPRPFYNRFPSPNSLVTRAATLLQPVAARLDVALQTGTSLTVSSSSGTTTRGRLLEQRWGGSCENMEGAAVAQVCSAWGTPWLEIRAISNLVEDRDTSTWDLPRAARHAQEAVLSLVAEITREEWQP